MQESLNSVDNLKTAAKESWSKPEVNVLDIKEETLLHFNPIQAIHFFEGIS